ncbi:hypothetical protein [Corallococcus sp. AB011P]|uniref:hypothetical protein n=1 Tax=Corallococcus sp. AB011P TaxID=2316735 RepID=UPI0011C4A27E|nr:hypothetical protein [Corallococcus sp. AB011P]
MNMTPEVKTPAGKIITNMATEISGKKITKEMRDLAESTFRVHPVAMCVCVGVRHTGGRKAKGRAVDGRARLAFAAINGKEGRIHLMDNLTVLQEFTGVTAGTLTADLITMASSLNIYGSAKRGSKAIVQQAPWTTHNCAESNLALFIYKLGMRTHDFTIAAYGNNDGRIDFKAPCSNCAQWVRQHFKMLTEYEGSLQKSLFRKAG